MCHVGFKLEGWMNCGTLEVLNHLHPEMEFASQCDDNQ